MLKYTRTTHNSKQSKRILVVCQHYWPETFRINEICDYFIEKGYLVDVLCGIPNYPHGKFFEGYGYFKNRKQVHNSIRIMRVFEIPRGRGSNLGIFINNISFVIASLFHIPKLLTKKYDKIFLYQLSPVMMSTVGILLGKYKKIETTMWVIDIWPDNLIIFLGLKNKLLKKIAAHISRWHYRNVDKIIALTDPMKAKLKKITHINDESIIALPQSCEKLYEQTVPDKRLNKKFKDTFNILFTGAITPILSFDTVLRAAVILKEKKYEDIRWIIVGEGMSLSWLKKEVRNLGLTKYFSFEGLKPMKEIPKYTTNAADVLLSTLVKNKLMEVTVPAKIASYMAAGKPLVLSMDGEPSKLVGEAGAGLVGPAEDAKKLAENIEALYKLSPYEREIIGKKARAYYDSNFERNVVMNKLEQFLFN